MILSIINRVVLLVIISLITCIVVIAKFDLMDLYYPAYPIFYSFCFMLLTYVIILIIHLLRKQYKLAKKDTFYFLIAMGIIIIPILLFKYILD